MPIKKKYETVFSSVLSSVNKNIQPTYLFFQKTENQPGSSAHPSRSFEVKDNSLKEM